MIIAIDFDGTCVTHEYPYIGKDIGAIPVLKELIAEGHKLILYTMRSGKELIDAVNWLNERDITLFGANTNPEQGNWTLSPKVEAHLYIDDRALGIPLIMGKSHRPFVDWEEVRNILVKYGILPSRKIDITNQNREGQKIWFEMVEPNLYTIHTTSSYALEYARFIYEDVPSDSMLFDFEHNGKKGIYQAFDPSGGPYIGVGNYKINGETVVRIFYKDNKLLFKTHKPYEVK